MKRALYVFLSTFALGAAASLVAGGCGMGDCDCPILEEPITQSGYRIDDVGATSDSGDFAESTLKIENGTIDVARDTVRIEYDHDGVHEVVLYDVKRRDF